MRVVFVFVIRFECVTLICLWRNVGSLAGLGSSFGCGLPVESVAVGPTEQWCVLCRLLVWKA